MPWSCCGALRLDSEPRCPACGADKQKWTARFQKTRVFRIQSFVWIEVQVHDVHGVPCAGEPYRLWLPDGELREGTLDDKGVLREPRLPVAREHKHLPCALELPGLDAADVLGPDDVPPGPDDAWIAVRVLDDLGQPAAGEAFRLELPGGEVVEGVLDDDGGAYLERIPPGGCRLWLPGLDAADLLVDHEDVVPATPERAWLAFALTDDLGAPQAGVRWRATLDDGSTREGTLGPDGGVALDDLPPGRARLEFLDVDAADWSAGPGVDVATRDVTAAPAAPPAWLSVELVDELGAPQAGLAWRVTLADGSTREGTLDEGGRLLLEGVPAGSCRLELPDVDAADWRDGPGVRVKGAADVAGPAAVLDAWLAARVVDALGVPARGAAWKVTLPDGAAREGTLDDEGQLVLQDIPAGACRLEFPDIDGADFTRDGG